MGTNFWELLHQRQDQLTRSGHAVADYLLQHADEAQYLSISSLARECNVAEATVFRFCRALGFDGYHEMRIALAQATPPAHPPARGSCSPVPPPQNFASTHTPAFSPPSTAPRTPSLPRPWTRPYT